MKYEKPWEGGGGGGGGLITQPPLPSLSTRATLNHLFSTHWKTCIFSISLRYKFVVLPNVWIVHRYHTLSPLSFAHLTVS